MYEDGEQLTWHDGRWHLGEHGIHAGDTVEVWGVDQYAVARWRIFRIESHSAGRVIFLVVIAHGLEFRRELTQEVDGAAAPQRVRHEIVPALRWPGGAR